MIHRIRHLIFAALAAGAFAACVQPTTFAGAPKVPSGAAGCRATCSAQGMELAGMVFMGEYSDGCICALPGQSPAVVMSGAAAQAGAVGVRMQMTRQEEESRRRQQTQTYRSPGRL
jgi:hypothetical protein